jgi:quinol monooxygenase YgiN
MTMTEIRFNLTFDIDPENFEQITDLADILTTMSRQEPGCLAYECSVSNDRSKIYMVERFNTSSSAYTHITDGFSQHAEAWGNLTSLSTFVVTGNPDDDVRALLPPNVLYVETFTGFTK